MKDDVATTDKPYLSDTVVILLVVAPITLCVLLFVVARWDTWWIREYHVTEIAAMALPMLLSAAGVWMVVWLKGIYKLCAFSSLAVAALFWLAFLYKLSQ
ncbi:hypothetical protein FBF28_00205 [Candidatus Saccharibacteria bacterium oral taxon 488]|nr:hypothetical protein FBF28_00205 [Candidatus Saccharibacteria bacterium oral taxon 488]